MKAPRYTSANREKTLFVFQANLRELPNGEIVAARKIDQCVAPALTGVRLWNFRQGAIKVETRGIDP